MSTFASRAGRRLALIAAAPLLLMPTVAACSGDDSAAASADVGQILAKAKTALDQATTVHFVLTSKDVPTGEGTKLIGGEGFAVRPQSFTGSLKLLSGGSALTIDLISVGGKVYVKAPFTEGFVITDPQQFGLKDPATLVDQRNGVVRLITSMTGAALAGESRVGSEVVQEITGTVPGTVVDELLTSADPAKPVTITASVERTTGQLRQAVLTGPFYAAATTSTFTIVFDRYGEKVTVDAPAVG